MFPSEFRSERQQHGGEFTGETLFHILHPTVSQGGLSAKIFQFVLQLISWSKKKLKVTTHHLGVRGILGQYQKVWPLSMLKKDAEGDSENPMFPYSPI